VFPRSVILIAQELINFLSPDSVVLNFLTKMYVQSMYMKCINYKFNPGPSLHLTAKYVTAVLKICKKKQTRKSGLDRLR
jgi:hypothetical protein